MKLRSIFAILLWVVVLTLGWFSDPWRDDQGISFSDKIKEIHGDNFHMHDPLHPGGKVTMAGQFHFELASDGEGTHHIWVSDAYRRELDPAKFSGQLIIKPENGDALEVTLTQVGQTKKLIAMSETLQGQVWFSLQGHYGTDHHFKNVKFFWDYSPIGKEFAPPLGLDSMVPQNPANLLTSQKVSLGKELFFDPLLSSNGKVSCSTCHSPRYAYAEPFAMTIGVNGIKGRRNTPTILNTVYLPKLFWDGRSSSLEDQAKGPILNHDEMGIKNEAELVTRLNEKYATAVIKATGEELSLKTVTDLLACFERTLFSGDSDFDRFENGDKTAISDKAHRGRRLFFGKAKCGTCHIPPLFTDFAFHNLGVGWNQKDNQDRGRFEVTGEKSDLGLFKTPSLRDVSITAPYMHDGSFATLEDVINYYNQGCRHIPTLDPVIKPLNLTLQEKKDLIEFLNSLNGRFQTK